MALCSLQKDPHAAYSTAYNIGFVPEANVIFSDILILNDADTNLTYVSLHLYIADNSCLCHRPALLHENNIQRLIFQIIRNYTTPCVFHIQLGKQKIRNMHTHFYLYPQHANVLCISVVSQLIYLNSFATNCNNEPPHEVTLENLMKRGKKQQPCSYAHQFLQSSHNTAICSLMRRQTGLSLNMWLLSSNSNKAATGLLCRVGMNRRFTSTVSALARVVPASMGTRVQYIAAQVKPDDDERQHLSNCSSPFHFGEHQENTTQLMGLAFQRGYQPEGSWWSQAGYTVISIPLVRCWQAQGKLLFCMESCGSSLWN